MDCAALRQHSRTEKQCTEEQQQEEQLMQGQLQSSTKLLGAGITTVCQELEASEVCHPKIQKFVQRFDSNSRNYDRVQTCLDLINRDQVINYDQPYPAERVSVLEPVSVDSETESETSESSVVSEATTVIDVDQIISLNYDLQIDAVPDAVTEDIQQFDGMKFFIVLFFYRFEFIICGNIFVIVFMCQQKMSADSKIVMAGIFTDSVHMNCLPIPKPSFIVVDKPFHKMQNFLNSYF